MARMSTTSIATIPKTAVKIVSTKVLPKDVRGVAQPLRRAAEAGLGQVVSVTKAGDVLL